MHYIGKYCWYLGPRCIKYVYNMQFEWYLPNKTTLNYCYIIGFYKDTHLQILPIVYKMQ